MKQHTKLYIDDKLVDFSTDLSMPFTYQLKDVNNPTIVKNPFTKTIDIIGTANNNKIFGEIYNLDRKQVYKEDVFTGAYFNPSIRTPFKIYSNGNVIESGYMQLNSITIKNGDINYNVTLYGGIGNFFYSLMYNSESEPLTLADLHYGVENSRGVEIASENEFDFTIDKSFVWSCWRNLDKQSNLISNFINFIPSYNGLPENFDSDKVLINTKDNSYWNGVITKTDNNLSYTTYNNYVLATLPRKYTEWEMLDLRSYLQRPALRMKRLIQACCKPENNGGYTVELDSDFFNDDNPYYNDAWIALPLLNHKEKEKNNVTTTNGRLVFQDLKVGDYDLGGGYTLTAKEKTDYLVPTSSFSIHNNTNIVMSNFPVGTLLNVEADFKLEFITNNLNNENLYLGNGIYEWGEEYGATTYFGHQTAVTLQLIAYDASGTILGSSDLKLFSYYHKFYSTAIDKKNYMNKLKDWTPFTDAPFDVYDGVFVKSNDRYVYESSTNSNFHLVLNNIPYTDEIKLGIRIERVIDQPPFEIEGVFNYGTLCNAPSYKSRDEFFNNVVNGYFAPSFTNISISRDEPDIITTNSKITKEILLKTERTPADYLLSYSKLFNLFYTVDENTKTVKIQTMSNYFTGKVIDWNDKIDYSREIKIKPLMFDKKFYRMKQDGESYYLDKYKNEYSVDYGQKRINTNYNFNAETEDLFGNNVFQNAVSAIDTSPYYHTFYDKSNNTLAPFDNANYTYQLFNKSTSGITSIDVDYKTPVIKGGWSWNSNSGYDNFPKTCFYNLENGEKSLSDISSVLLFYNGKVNPKDFKGQSLRYKLSDDLAEMYELNDKTPCWLFSDYDYDANNSIITYDCTTLPRFLRYKIFGNQVQASWDFGKPKEIYIPDTNYPDNTTIYNQYWKGYYNDQLNINTKEVTCYVNLNDIVVNGELLRNFYYFNGCYWILNKIDNYNINDTYTTLCHFIRVNSLGNYSK